MSTLAPFSVAEKNSRVRKRERGELTAGLHIGPTNSGKTWNALNELYESFRLHPHKTHVYAGPLRMLAYEVYQKMCAEFGEDNVGFITGEEQINPAAKLIACTIEMAPPEGETVVVDEAHWLIDNSRGHKWTGLLIGDAYTRVIVVTAGEAVAVIQKLLRRAGRVVQESHHSRKTPLTFKGSIDYRKLPQKTAVVCFSRKTIYATARALKEAGYRVGVLYGALPLKSRLAQISKYEAQKYDVIVTTDVIGHGINLPIDNVVFIQTDKFDGEEMRALRVWELAQIAGRAGRFGISDEGGVYYATGLPWCEADPALLKRGVSAAAGRTGTDLVIEAAYLSPVLSDMLSRDAGNLELDLLKWQDAVNRQYSAKADGLQASPLTDEYAMLHAVLEHNNGELYSNLALEDYWTLITGPYNANSQHLGRILRWLDSGASREVSGVLDDYFTRTMKAMDKLAKKQQQWGEEVKQFEFMLSLIQDLKTTYQCFKTLGTLPYAAVLEQEDRIADAITNMIQRVIDTTSYGKCEKCGSATMPWFKMCEQCYYFSN